MKYLDSVKNFIHKQYLLKTKKVWEKMCQSGDFSLTIYFWDKDIQEERKKFNPRVISRKAWKYLCGRQCAAYFVNLPQSPIESEDKLIKKIGDGELFINDVMIMEPGGSGFKFKETSFNEIKNLEEGIVNKIKINHEFGTEKLLMIMDECGHNKEVNINKAVGDRYYISFNINYQEIEKLIDWCL